LEPGNHQWLSPEVVNDGIGVKERQRIRSLVESFP
jgi:hypothetical protein